MKHKELKIQVLKKEILKVSQLIQLEGLTIPLYQRPYKWTGRNIHQLFQDIQSHREQSAYRLGTLVFHCDEKESRILNIVDGQQRTLTLMLTIYALIEDRLSKLERQDLSDQLNDLVEPLTKFMEKQTFESEISQHNLYDNFQEIKRLVSRIDFTEQHIDFLLNRCEVVSFTLNDISEAFQFFDSQNSRGRDLEPHDLLKAYHLREFSDHEQVLKASTVAGWEDLESHELTTLFAEYLYRIRRWSSGYSARYFGKNEIGVFKGINIDQIAQFPYVESLLIAHHYVDDYNVQYHRKIDKQQKNFPFQLDQMIINGRRFFEMASHYQKQAQIIVQTEFRKSKRFWGVELSQKAQEILDELNHYSDRNRTGDKYVRAIFDCSLIFYIDKFGTAELSNAIEKLFIWAYQLRIKQQAVQLATIDNHVLNHNIFRVIKDAVSPSDVLTLPLRSLTDADNKNNERKGNSDQDTLVKLFKGMNYYE
ncbi:DUF262 domain-containing protein [Acinetobacter johnsonii]|uniref:Uncharacterized protein n=1 Tax=Acinetobacter johnsonii TaxID=40214 RepID=A0A1R7QDN6_ACIJO|nr:DUF262 domain-containing protein [Acinetobacter johnsonii]SJX22390.1 hypothetical protein ACNJC6_02032 [Acinetobacter johnsonii]